MQNNNNNINNNNNNNNSLLRVSRSSTCNENIGTNNHNNNIRNSNDVDPTTIATKSPTACSTRRKVFRVVHDERSSLSALRSLESIRATSNNYNNSNTNVGTCNWNIFARLPPSIVQDLYNNSIITSTCNAGISQSTPFSGWSLTTTGSSNNTTTTSTGSLPEVSSSSSLCSSGIEFLPLVITPLHVSDNVDRNSKEGGTSRIQSCTSSTIYVSYNGGDCYGNCKFDDKNFQ